ncbi:MAG: hypothetical protein D4R64_03710 [Porphyromonadaceae bacterium]|nr:MAG: hypothetical protein D4R64_03710 [Porphyromonadaceae bacterium]
MKLLAIRLLIWELILIAFIKFSFSSFGSLQEEQNLSSNPAEGLISVWLKPDWNYRCPDRYIKLEERGVALCFGRMENK